MISKAEESGLAGRAEDGKAEGDRGGWGGEIYIRGLIPSLL